MVGPLLDNAAEASKDEMQMQTKTDAGPAILDFEAAAFALLSSLRAALAETGHPSLDPVDPAFAFHSRLRFSPVAFLRASNAAVSHDDATTFVRRLNSAP